VAKVADLYALLSIKPDKASGASAQRFINGVKSGLKAVGVLAGVATAAMGKMIGDTAAAADQYAKMSKQVGISVEGLQQLEFAAKISGTGLGALRTGLQRFARTADDAGQGLKTAQEPFERLGVAFEDGEGKARPLEAMLGDIADKFQQLPDGTRKTALAMKTFGRAGAQLIPLLNEGSAGVDKLKAEFTELGAEISGDQAKGFEEYNDTMLRVRTMLTGFRNQAVIALLPQLKKISGQILAWAKANRELIKQKLAAFMKGMVKFVIALVKVVGFLIKNAKALVIGFAAWKAALLAVALAQKIVAAEGVVAAVKLAAAWLAAALPIILMIVLFVALVLVIEDFVAFLTGKESIIGSVFGEAIEQWLQDFDMFFNEVRKGFQQMGTDLLNSPTMRLISMTTGSSAAFDQIKKLHKAGIVAQVAVDQRRSDTAGFRRRQAAQDLAPELFSAQESVGVFAENGGGVGGGVSNTTGAPVGNVITNTFTFQGVGTEETARMVQEKIKESEETTANAIAQDIP